jgi:hypothetical protein
VSDRTRVTAYFDESDNGELMPLFVAVGRAVLAAAGLEQALRLEIVRLLVERKSATGIAEYPELATIEGLTGGQLVRELRALGLDPDLDERFGAAINRRNELVHNLIEDPQVVRALNGDGMDAVVKRIEQLALDCAGLLGELHIVATPKLEARLGKSRAELFEIVKARDPATIEDPRERRQIEAIRALGDIELPAGLTLENGDHHNAADDADPGQ